MRDHQRIFECEHIESETAAHHYSFIIEKRADPENKGRWYTTQINVCKDCYRRLEADVMRGLIRMIAGQLKPIFTRERNK